MGGKKHVVFDVLGTCVSFNAFTERVEATIGESLRSHNITADSFQYTWRTATELEFTYLSISKRYQPYVKVLETVFYRTLWLMGVKEPKKVATDEQRDQCIKGFSELKLRPDVEATFAKLRDNGFTVWCLTTGDAKRVRDYFVKGGVDIPEENFISCDSKGLAKPALESYQPALDKFAEDDVKWFAAAHMWDVSSAKKAGFKGAYCTIYEQDPCYGVYEEEMDITTDTLLELAEKIVASSAK